ncbi:hypothetical protein BGZ96_003552 [Linnemannia gamsii]|uniref:HCP-like protein n=1 Tax=Linnemannia gamsii TaxID=64522 RepID=A0ABQ7JJ16_9FUNG|nr:hypothetical protein BGZ96_003552 [Linnemannia gamsii]
MHSFKKIFQRNTPEGHVQAFRSVDKSILPSAVPPATEEEVIHIDTQLDPETQKEIVLWDDILQAFKNADVVRNKTRVVTFLKGKDLTILHPRRIAAVPNSVLDVVIDTTKIDMKANASDVTLASRRNPAYGLEEAAIENYNHMERPFSVPLTWGVPAALDDQALDKGLPVLPTIDVQGTTFDVTSAGRRNPAYGLEEVAMENWSHIDRPLSFPSARGVQAIVDDQVRLANDRPVSPHPDSGNHLRVRGPQSPTSAAKKDLAQLGISAMQGDAAAQVALGDMYRDGNGVPRDDQAALDWYRLAAEQEDPIGQIRLGELYMYGQGVPQDYAKSLDWYLLAANRGIIRAQREMADFYYNGRGVAKDYVQAMVWYRKAADQGDAGSQCKIGSLYEYGNGVGADHLKAAEWYQKAADQDHAFAKKCLRALKDKGMSDK